jgi:hypothetical protein
LRNRRGDSRRVVGNPEVTARSGVLEIVSELAVIQADDMAIFSDS